MQRRVVLIEVETLSQEILGAPLLAKTPEGIGKISARGHSTRLDSKCLLVQTNRLADVPFSGLEGCECDQGLGAVSQ